MKLDFIPANIRIFVMPTLFLIILVVLFTFSIRLGFKELSSQRQEIEKLQKDENILREKESLLRNLESSILPQADSALIALPEKNPALTVISQLKNLALQKGTIIDNLKAGSPQEEEGGLSKIDITFDIDGTFFSIFDFATSVKNIAPIAGLQRLELSDAGAGGSRATISVRSYWASFPEKIPTVSEPVKGLVEKDQEILSLFATLTPPSFIEISPIAPGFRADPFNF